MSRINLLRLAVLSCALLGPLVSVARADSDGRDGPTPRQLRQEAAQQQAPSMPHAAILAQGRSGVATDAGMGIGPVWGAGIYDQTDGYRDPVTGIQLPGSSSESLH